MLIKVLAATSSAPSLYMPPPLAVVVLLIKVLALTASLPLLLIPPPLRVAKLPVIAPTVTVS